MRYKLTSIDMHKRQMRVKQSPTIAPKYIASIAIYPGHVWDGTLVNKCFWYETNAMHERITEQRFNKITPNKRKIVHFTLMRMD